MQQASALPAPLALRVPVLLAQQELALRVPRALLALKERQVQVLTALAEPLVQPAPQVLQVQV